jgi:hypothetical protein
LGTATPPLRCGSEDNSQLLVSDRRWFFIGHLAGDSEIRRMSGEEAQEMKKRKREGTARAKGLSGSGWPPPVILVSKRLATEVVPGLNRHLAGDLARSSGV